MFYQFNVPKRFSFYGAVLVFMLSLALLAGCASQTGYSHRKPEAPPQQAPGYPKPYKVLGKWYQPLPSADGFSQTGLASWYGDKFHGNPTSSGEIYDMNKVSAAHKILPLGTYVRVHNMENNRTLDIRINDRGPFVAGRIIDLSKEAAKKLGVYGPGTARVRIVALGKRTDSPVTPGREYVPVDYSRGNFSIQVGAFREMTNANNLMYELDKTYHNVHIRPTKSREGAETLYRVLVGKCSTLSQAQQYEQIMRSRGYENAFMVAE